MHAETLTYLLGLSSHVLELNTRDVSHEESLVKPPKGGSCLNQVLGHLTRTRNLALATMGQKAPFPMEDFDPYDDRTGVPFSRENALPFDELRRRFKATQQPLIRTIHGMSAEILASPPPRNLTGDPNETVGSNLATFVFHEAVGRYDGRVVRRYGGTAVGA